MPDEVLYLSLAVSPVALPLAGESRNQFAARVFMAEARYPGFRRVKLTRVRDDVLCESCHTVAGRPGVEFGRNAGRFPVTFTALIVLDATQRRVLLCRPLVPTITTPPDGRPLIWLDGFAVKAPALA